MNQTWQHGTRAGYYYNRCSCEQCRAFAADYQRRANAERRAKGLPADDPRHGSWNAYVNWGCRCEPCTQAGREAKAQQKARRSAR